MKKYFSIIRVFIITLVVFLTGCVHDDEYAAPDLKGNLCQNESYFTDPKNEFVKWTLLDLKNKTQNQPFTENAYVEGYVASSDESGNVYKYLYIQDSPSNPTQGLVVSANAISMYTRYPQGYKVYIKLKGLAMGTYGGIKQLGYYGIDPDTNALDFGRIPEKLVFSSIVRSCSEKETITPKELTLIQIRNATDQNQYMGCLIKVPNAEFDAKALCSIYAPEGFTVDRALNDATYTNPTNATVVARNSGFASFANQTLPSGKGDFIGILSKFGSTFQFYINKGSDLSGMKNFPRKDAITADPCGFEAAGLSQKTVAEVKQLYTSGNFNQITGDFYLKAKVTTSDETGNLFKYLYVEDATGGIRVNINKSNLYQDARFKLGKNVIIKLKDLYIGKFNGEFQIGQPNGSNIGQIAENVVYKYFIDSKEAATPLVPTEKTISELTATDVGRWIKIKGVEFSAADLGTSFGGTRTIEDCSGKTIPLVTSSFASFASKEVDSGKGDIYAILTQNNSKLQLLIPYQVNADLDALRCDGASYESIFFDPFLNLGNWTAVNVAGAQVWNYSNQGTGSNYYAVMSGNGNEDWLISKKITIPASTYKEVFFSFESEGRSSSSGNPLEVYVTDNYTGSVSTTVWTKMVVNLDTDLANFAGFVNSGKVNVSSFKGKDLVVAFKYISTATASTTWEIDNFSVKGLK